MVISRKAGEAVLRGAQVFVPGVLAVTAGLAAGDLVAVMVALDKPGWCVKWLEVLMCGVGYVTTQAATGSFVQSCGHCASPACACMLAFHIS
jgi:predicted ribosome-associated RNA-binding protein Tma20